MSVVPLPSIRAAHKLHFNAPQENAALSDLASLELEYFKAYSQFRRRNYEKCVDLCNTLLQATQQRDGNAATHLFAGSAAVTATGIKTNNNTINNNNDINELNARDLLLNEHNNSNTNTNSTSNANENSKYNNNNVGGVRYNSHLQRRISGGGGLKHTSHHNHQQQQQQQQPNQQQQHGTTATAAAAVIMPTWMLEGVWQLKMRALTQRVYVDDLETNDADDEVNEEVEFERIATAARPGTSIKNAFVQRPSTSIASSRQLLRQTSAVDNSEVCRSSGRPRPTSAMARPGTGSASRPTSALAGGRPVSRCTTASRVRATSAAAFTVGDATAPLYQASRLNPTIYAERQVLVKTLFQFLFYHESDVEKAHSLCEAVMNVANQQGNSTLRRDSSTAAALGNSTTYTDWWWAQQLGRCLLTLKYPRRAEVPLQQSLAIFAHPDTYLLLSRLYQRLDEPHRALELITTAVDRHPFDVTFRTEQGRVFDAMNKPQDALQIFRLISRLNPINIEALASIALSYFYDNNPEMALMYYRRIISLGVHTAELYCNIALCCLYGGQIDLVLPCFTRALKMAETNDQRAAIWYNLSFVAITTGDFGLARRCLQLCLTCNGRNGSALNNLAVLAAHSGDLLKAKTYLNAAKEVLSEDCNELTNNMQYMNERYKL